MALVMPDTTVQGGGTEQTAKMSTTASLVSLGVLSASAFLALFVDGLMNERAFFDLPLMKLIQRVDFPGIHTYENIGDQLTGSPGVFVVWGLAFLVLVLLRQWASAFAIGFIPPTALINYAFGAMVDRTRPHLPELERTSLNWEERSFPSGHTQAGVMIFGFILVMAARIKNPALRWTIQGGSVAVMITSSFGRIWSGAHWPSDVLGAATLGVTLLVPILLMEQRLRAAWDGLPLFSAGEVRVPNGLRYTRALTSTVVFDDEAGTVTKVYRPGIVPRLLYWAAFQAPFGYESNRDALRAAVARRNVARALTQYWYGAPRVAEATGTTRVGTRTGLVSELIHGQAPADRAAAKAFLMDLRARFDEAGLPTWQIDPRQPRAVDNVLETGDGYQIVDLESGLVAPLATRTAWLRAVKAGRFPLYDDVDFATMRAYVRREGGRMAERFGSRWLTDLMALIDEAEQATTEWHHSELRLWSRLLSGSRNGVGYREWPQRAKAAALSGQDRGTQWLTSEVNRWHAEGRLSDEQAQRLERQIASPAFQLALPYFGAHVAVSIVLRFPLGSIVRSLMVLTALGYEGFRLMSRRSTRADFREAMRLHSPRVVIAAAVPGIGMFAYLLSPAVAADPLLVRILADSATSKLPFDLYTRTRMDRLLRGTPKYAVPGAERWRTEVETEVAPAPVPSLAEVGRESGMLHHRPVPGPWLPSPVAGRAAGAMPIGVAAASMTVLARPVSSTCVIDQRRRA